MKEPDSLFLHRRQILEMQSTCRDFQGPVRDVQTYDCRERLVLQKFTEESSLTTAKIEDAFRTATAKSCDNSPHPLFGQTDGFFDGFFLAGVSLRQLFRFGLFFADEAAQCLASEPFLMLQIAIGNQFTFGMRPKPALAM